MLVSCLSGGDPGVTFLASGADDQVSLSGCLFTADFSLVTPPPPEVFLCKITCIALVLQVTLFFKQFNSQQSHYRDNRDTYLNANHQNHLSLYHVAAQLKNSQFFSSAGLQISSKSDTPM